MPEAQLAAIEHIVVLMLENRSFDHMLGFLYTGENNVSPAGDPFEGLFGSGANMAFRTDAIRALGGFAVDLGAGTQQ